MELLSSLPFLLVLSAKRLSERGEAVLRLTTSASRRTALGCPSISSTSASVASSSSSKRSSPYRLFANSLLLSRVPVELGGAMTLMPLHNATASALMTSLLCLSSRSWGCLSEGFATPL